MREMRGEVGKETSKKEMDFYDVTWMIFDTILALFLSSFNDFFLLELSPNFGALPLHSRCNLVCLYIMEFNSSDFYKQRFTIISVDPVLGDSCSS